MNRGELRMYTFPPPDKRRPVLILTRQPALRFLTKVTVAPVTRRIRGIPTEVVIEPEEGLRERSAINLDNVSTVHASQLGPVIAAVDEVTMSRVEEALAFALGFRSRLR